MKDWWWVPAAAVYARAQSGRKDARNVVFKAAAGDVGQAFDGDGGFFQFQEGWQIGAMRGKNGVDQRYALFQLLVQVAALKDTANEGVAVCVGPLLGRP